MKLTIKNTALVTALVALPALAFAQYGKDDGDRAARKAEMVQKYDANGDGTLDEAEREALHSERKAKREARRAEKLAQYDANGNGTLEEPELEAMHQARVDARFAKLDTNNDGVLSKAEFAAAKGHERGHRGKRGKWGKRGERGERGERGNREFRGQRDR